jgi:hypothetical protein
MKAKYHFTMLLVAFIAWAAFYFIGLPSDYYTSWSLTEKILIILISFFAVFPAFSIMINIFLEGDYMKLNLWLALYASVGIFIFDFIAVGLIEGKGIGFLITHWIQTAGYIMPWIIFPLIANTMKKYEEKLRSKFQKSS